MSSSMIVNSSAYCRSIENDEANGFDSPGYFEYGNILLVVEID